jgi:sorbitol/mannitol transport system substrate-binding protein
MHLRMRTRFAAVIAALVCGAGMLTAVAAGASGSTRPGSVQLAKSITVWVGSGGFWDYEAAHLAPFEKETGITVDFVELPSATGLSKEEIALRAHNSSFAMYETPTSVSYYNVAFGAEPQGSFIANSTLTPSSFDYGDLSSGLMLGCTINGKTYCMPVFVDGGVLAYNTKLFAKAGISSPPKTWNQVKTDADQITTKTGTPGWCTRGSEAGAAIYTANLMLAYYLPYNKYNKGFMVSPNWHSLLDSPQAVQMYTLYQHLMTKDAPSGVSTFTYENCLDLYEEGKVAMDWDGIGVVSGPPIFSPAPSSPIHGAVGFDEIDCPTMSPCVPSGPWGMFINSYAPKAEQNSAWLLMEYLDSKQFLKSEMVSLVNPDLAVRTSLTSTHIAGVPSSLLAAEGYVEAHIEPHSFPPTAVFDASQNDYQIAISDIAAGGSIQKELSFAAQGMDAAFKQAGLLK